MKFWKQVQPNYEEVLGVKSPRIVYHFVAESMEEIHEINEFIDYLKRDGAKGYHVSSHTNTASAFFLLK